MGSALGVTSWASRDFLSKSLFSLPLYIALANAHPGIHHKDKRGLYSAYQTYMSFVPSILMLLTVKYFKWLSHWQEMAADTSHVPELGSRARNDDYIDY